MNVRLIRKTLPSAFFAAAICFQTPVIQRSIAAEPPAKAQAATAVDRLGDRIVALSPGKVRQLHDYLTSISAGPLDAKDGAAKDGKALKKPAAPALASIGDAICRLTLAEAGLLGEYLDRKKRPDLPELALASHYRQHRALLAVKAVQKRVLSNGPGGITWVDDAVTLKKCESPWLEKRLGRQPDEVVGLGFAWEHEDFGRVKTDVSDEDMRHVAALPGLRTLDLEMSLVGDRGVALLAGLRHLTALDLAHSKVTDAGLQHIGKLTMLQTLELSSTKLTDAGLKHLVNLNRLTDLKLNSVPIDGSGFEHLTACPLKNISLSGTRLTDQGAARLNALKLLEEISISSKDLKVLSLADLPQLRHVTVGSHKSIDLRLRRLPSLDYLGISISNRDKPSAALVLEDLPKLRSLRCSCPLDEAAMRQIGGVTNLRSLWLSYGRADARGISHLRRLDKLEVLAVRCSDGGDRAMQAFAGMTSLKRLYFTATDVTDDGLRHLRHLRNVEEIVISGIRATGKGFGVLGALPKLKELEIYRSELDSFRLQGHESLERLRIYQCRIKDLRLEELPALKHLYVGQTRVIDIHIDDLPKLGWLDMSLKDAHKIDKVLLRNMPNLGTLKIIPISGASIGNISRRANITDDALRYLDTFTNLKNFEMAFTKVTDRTLEKFKNLKQLNTIELSSCNITDAGLQHLRGLDRLIFLHVAGKKITPEARAEVMKTIRELRKRRDRK